MGIWELILVAVGLAMDAFAVAICKGLSMRSFRFKHAAIIALFFGAFQAIMPLLGWLLGSQFAKYITDFDHWIAFVLLAFIGGKMIKEAFDKEEECPNAFQLDVKELFVLAIATSIDALAVGITFAFLQVSIALAASLIGVITFALSLVGVIIGIRFGSKFKSKAEFAGGAVLVLIGLKILLEHLGILVI